MDVATIESYGDYFYLITFLWTFLEGETFVIFGGFAAQKNVLRLDLLIFFAWFGSFCGDQLYFGLGRFYGHRLLRRFPRFQSKVDLALDWLRRYSTGFILTYRFIYGVRNVSSFALGMSVLPWPRFLLLNFFGAGIWAVTFAGTGYLFGKAFDTVLADNVKDVQNIMISMLVLFVAVIGVKFVLHRRRKEPLIETPSKAAVDTEVS